MLIVWPNTMPRLRHFTWRHLDELHGEGGLAHAAAAEHHDLVLTHVPNLRLESEEIVFRTEEGRRTVNIYCLFYSCLLEQSQRSSTCETWYV